MARIGQPGDIANIAVVLGSGDAGWLTDEELRAGVGTHQTFDSNVAMAALILVLFALVVRVAWDVGERESD